MTDNDQSPAGAPEQTKGPGFAERGRMRRRVRFLRRIRELGLRDLGGLVYDMRRYGQEKEELIAAKVTALEATDAELRVLEQALDDHRKLIELREAGISSCPQCGAIVASDSRYCQECGKAQ